MVYHNKAFYNFVVSSLVFFSLKIAQSTSKINSKESAFSYGVQWSIVNHQKFDCSITPIGAMCLHDVMASITIFRITGAWGGGGAQNDPNFQFFRCNFSIVGISPRNVLTSTKNNA